MDLHSILKPVSYNVYYQRRLNFVHDIYEVYDIYNHTNIKLS